MAGAGGLRQETEQTLGENWCWEVAAHGCCRKMLVFLLK